MKWHIAEFRCALLFFFAVSFSHIFFLLFKALLVNWVVVFNFDLPYKRELAGGWGAKTKLSFSFILGGLL